MKIYVLYDNPFNDGWNVHGVFSSEEKVNEAIKKFAGLSNYELFWDSFNVDSLEKFFDVDIPRLYLGYSPVYHKLDDTNIKYITWQSMNLSDLDSLLSSEPKKNSILLSNALWLHVFAKNKEDAIQRGNEMLKELIKQPEDARGWKYYEN